jgi:hypothetical protein
MVASVGGVTHEALRWSTRSPKVERAPVERSCDGALSGLRSLIDVGESRSATVVLNGLLPGAARQRRRWIRRDGQVPVNSVEQRSASATLRSGVVGVLPVSELIGSAQQKTEVRP